MAQLMESNAIPSILGRKRSQSISLDSKGGHQIDEDIHFRIRSLLLSRNTARPPRTPRTSPRTSNERRESHSIDSTDTNPRGLDFSSAKSLARRARNSIHRLSLPGRRLQTDGSNMDGGASPVTKNTKFRSTSSASDLNVLGKGGKLHETDDACCALKTPEDVQNYKPEPADLACFMAGCPAKECNVHRRRSSHPAPTSKPQHEFNTDIHAVARAIAKDMSKLSTAVRGLKYRDQPIPAFDCEEIHICEEEHRRGQVPTVAPKPPKPLKEPIPEPKAATLYDCTEFHACEDKTHGFLVPSATHYRRDLASPKSQLSPASTSNQESQPAELDQANDSVSALQSNQQSLAKQSDSSTNPQSVTPSILSSASQSSARHALLKPSITASSPIDTGLPISPVMTPVAVSTATENTSPIKLDDVSKDSQDVKVPVIKNLDNLRRARDLVSSVEDRIREASEALKQELGSTASVGPVSGSEPPMSSTQQYADSPKLPDSRSTAAADWVFEPADREAVHDAVQIAIVKAVHQIKMPRGIEKEQASAVYRQLFGESLTEAAQTADDYLRRPSLWEKATTPNSQENGGRSNKSKNQPVAPEYHHLVAVPVTDLDPESQGAETQSGWKLSRPFSNRGPEYTAIPTRHSSRKYILKPRDSPKDSLPTSSSVVSPKAVGSIHRSLQAIEDLRSVSSLGSMTSARATGAGTNDKESDREINGATGVASSQQKNRRKNTATWIRDLLANEKPYETRFTDLPPRTKRDEITSTGRIRSRTAPSRPVSTSCLAATSRPEDAVQAGTLTTDVRFMPAATSETFTKTISDLEHLLSEALCIARQAADRDGPAKVPMIKEIPATPQDKPSRARVLSTAYARRAPKTITRSDSLPSIHESLRSYSGSSGTEDSDDGSTGDEDDQHVPDLHLELPVVKISMSTQMSQTVHEEGMTSSMRLLEPTPPAAAAQPEISIARASPLKNDEINSDVGSSEAQFSTADPFTSPPLERHQTISRVSPGHISPSKNARSRATTNPKAAASGTKCIDEHHEDTHEGSSKSLPIPPATPRGASVSGPNKERQYDERLKRRSPRDSVPDKREVREHIATFHHPPIQPRSSSLHLCQDAKKQREQADLDKVSTDDTYAWQNIDETQVVETTSTQPQPHSSLSSATHHNIGRTQSQSFDGMSAPSDALDFETGFGHKQAGDGTGDGDAKGSRGIELKDIPQSGPRQRVSRPAPHLFNLKGRSHVSLRGEHHKGFSLTRSHKKQKIARDWSPGRKRFVATVACISTALIGILTGIYAACVPAIQYYIVDFHHYTILGNVFFFIGLAISTFLFWPLPLLHGRKPYVLGAMSLAMPLLFPQALAVGDHRSPYVSQWRVALLLPRAVMGFVLGFANMNFKSTLTDLFGASLQSANPHQEVVDENDVRRHGGGLGVWLGIWTWCTMASGGIGFLIGAIIINNANPAWGFYICIFIIALTLLLNVVCPEVRRSAFRRSVAEVKNGEQVSRRLARGEVKMHLKQTGPKWWGEEFHHGIILSLSMLRQPGFLVLAFYLAWIYGQIVLVVVLLGSLTSKYYHFKSPYIGASVAAVPLGALLAIPFQKAGLFSRERTHAEISDDDTRDKKVGWSSHLVRRAIFVLCLPFAGLAYTLSSNGPPIPFILPIFFAGLIGFLSNLAMAECHGIIMETFDTSDLQPGMTGRPRKSNSDKKSMKRTNYSSFPRVSSGFAITQGLGYLVAAIATGVGGVAERHLGQQAATSVMAGILLVLSLLLLGTLVRFREVQIIPDMHKESMDRYMNARRKSAAARGDNGINDDDLRPIIIGNPTHITRRMCILEMGSMSRWSEIRKKNHLVDQNSLEAKHPNLAVMHDVEDRIKAKEHELLASARNSLQSLSRKGSRRSLRSYVSADDRLEINEPQEPGDLGGHREMGFISGNGSGRKNKMRKKTTIRE